MTETDFEKVRNALPSVLSMAEDDGFNPDSTGSGEYRGAHPIHGSTTAGTGNFAVTSDGDEWYCFRRGHKHGGGKLEYVAMSEGIVDCGGLEDGTIPRELLHDVLEVAAARAGVALDSESVMSDSERAEAARRSESCRAVAEYYHTLLDEHDMRDELQARYGFTDELIDDNLIGYAPDAGMGHDLPGETGVDRDRLEALGLLRSGGSPWFTNRFVFPYWVLERGRREIGHFVGRALEPEHERERPKYLKLPNESELDEPPLGVDTVRGAKTVILAEGVTDALALHDHGYASVSPVTTHITGDSVGEFARKLRGKDVYAVYDEDPESGAGLEGAAKCAHALKEEGVDVTVCRLPTRPGEEMDVNEYFAHVMSDRSPAERCDAFETDVLDGVTMPADAAYWAWGGGEPGDLFAAAIDHLGFDPTRMEKRTNDDGDEWWVGVRDVLDGVRELPKARRLFYGDGKTSWSASTHKEAYHNVITWVCQARGEFFCSADTGDAFYYYNPDGKLYPVATSEKPGTATEEFRHFVEQTLGVSSNDWGRDLLNTVARSVSFGSPERHTAQFSHYDDDEGELYIDAYDGTYFALDGESVDQRRNGTDVFFQSDDDSEPFEYLAPEDRAELPNRVPGEKASIAGVGDRVMRVLCNRINFDENANLGPLLQRAQLYIHLHAMAFGSAMDGRPIMAWVGSKGAGKTVVLRSIGHFMFGEEWEPSTMPDNAEDFIAKVGNHSLAGIDNYDDGEPWANDLLAAVATGARVEKRELYTTNDMAVVKPKCFLALTSRDPPFRRDDVADRCLVFRLSRVSDDVVGESTYLKQPLIYRDDVWSDYLDNLNAIIRQRNSRDDSFRTTSHRMADWALFAEDIDEALDMGVADELLDGMQQERAFFALENEPLRLVVDEWMKQHPSGGEYEASELLDDFRAAADETGVMFEYASSRGLSKGLSSLSDELKELFGMEVVERGRGAKKYKFPPRGTGGDQARYHDDTGGGLDGGGGGE